MTKKVLYRTGGSPREWEYMVVVFEYFRDVWRPAYIGEKLLEDWQVGPSMSEFLSKLGIDGWELVMAMPDDKGEKLRRRHLIFKRPKD
jgi:hypothetical protein